MTKLDMTKKIAEDAGLKRSDVATIIQHALDTISAALGNNEKIEFRGFGVFKLKVRRAMKGRNPMKPGDEVIIPRHVVVKFRAGRELKNQVVKIKPNSLKS